jgi:hypothetical protein
MRYVIGSNVNCHRWRSRRWSPGAPRSRSSPRRGRGRPPGCSRAVNSPSFRPARTTPTTAPPIIWPSWFLHSCAEKCPPPRRPGRVSCRPSEALEGHPSASWSADCRTHYFAADGRGRPGETPLRMALSPGLPIRMRPLVQVQPGPQSCPLPAGTLVASLAVPAQPNRMHPVWMRSRGHSLS